MGKNAGEKNDKATEKSSTDELVMSQLGVKDAEHKQNDAGHSVDISAALLEHPSYIKVVNELSKAIEERDEFRNKLLLCVADFENAKRRFERDLDNAHKYAIDKLVVEFLPVIDSLELGLDAKFIDDGNKLIVQMRSGMELILDMMLKILQKYGVNQINPIGDAFDPHYHQAMMEKDDASAKPNTILTVMQKGYVLKERLIRPALVVVSK